MIISNIDGQSKQSPLYAWGTGTINKAGTAAGTNITSITGFTTLFTPFSVSVSDSTIVRKPHKIKVTADGTMYIKINGGQVITVDATNPFEAEDLIIDSLSVSDNSAGVSATVYLQ